MSKASVHGYIEIELHKKHGQKLIFHENILTQFGKSFVLSNGLGGLFGYGTTKTSNRIRCTGTRPADVYSNTYPVGPYLCNLISSRNTVYTDGSKVTNLLLNNPTLAVDKGLYLPTGDTLAGYAGLDTAASGTLKEGVISQLKDSQDRVRKIVRRFEYPSDLACEFNCIAMSTVTPGGANGRVVPLYRSVQPVVFNSQTMTPTDLRDEQQLGYHKLTDNQIVFTAANGNNYTVNAATGAIEEGGDIQGTILNKQVISVFNHNDYTYVVKMVANTSYSRSADISYDVLAADGTKVASYTFSPTYFSTSSSMGIIYYEGDFYYVWGYYNRWYKLTQDSSGILSFNPNSYITAPITLPTALFSVIGNTQSGYTTIQAVTTYSNSGPYVPGINWWYYSPTSFYLTDENYERTIGCTYNGGLFMCGNQILSFDLAEQYERDWCNKLPGLVEYGNILSYHMLEQPIQKNVGDTMYVTYSYTID